MAAKMLDAMFSATNIAREMVDKSRSGRHPFAGIGLTSFVSEDGRRLWKLLVRKWPEMLAIQPRLNSLGKLGVLQC